MIARTAPLEQSDWQEVLAGAFRSGARLLEYLGVDPALIHPDEAAERDFPVLVPATFAALMTPGDATDPLLRQVLAQSDELIPGIGFSQDPLQEQTSNVTAGVIHKYQGRVLVMAATGCAINCRYCFRRHFDYADNRIGRRQWQQVLDYVARDPEISEVILSGGDPLMLQDDHLSDLIDGIERIAHVRRLRIHSRLPVVIPQRVTDALVKRLADTHLTCTLVLHINHANEISSALREGCNRLRQQGILLLNQTVLLSGVNDQINILTQLSEDLADAGILPYYLHLLDKVSGAAHFDRPESASRALYSELHARLPGYLLPRLVREEAGQPGKTLIDMIQSSGA